MASNGETDLQRLLAHLDPEMDPSPYVFCSLSEARFQALPLEPWATVREPEGITIILAQSQADEVGLDYQILWARITLMVHSSLEAVGLMAAVAARLAEAGISLNPVAGYFHDHLFVPWDRRLKALSLLQHQ